LQGPHAASSGNRAARSTIRDEFAGDGIMLEGIAGPPDYLAMAAPLAGDRHPS
jgi:hypothetical protein